MASDVANQIAAKHNENVRAKTGGNQVTTYVDRLLALEEQKSDLSEDIKELKAEIKDNDFDPKAIAQIVKRKRETAKQRAKREALESTVDQYATLMGMLV